MIYENLARRQINANRYVAADAPRQIGHLG